MPKHLLLAFMVVFQFVFSNADACTAFRMPTPTDASDSRHVIVGRNFDWDYGHGLIVINKRGVAKQALALPESKVNVPNPAHTAQWVSKYGSLTFNQAGRELPYGGLNEKGLMIEILWLGYTAWPVTTAPSINEVQWIQYQLDTKSSVGELIAHLDDVRIKSVFATVHFIACDASGECATFEGFGDHVEVHTGVTMPIAALTNDTYDGSLKYATPFLSNGTCDAVVKMSKRSLDRFAVAACGIQNGDSSIQTASDQTARANSLLDTVAQGAYTKWRIVYDLTEKSISIRTSDAPYAKSVRLADFDLSCGKPAQILDLNANLRGGANDAFQDYDVKANRSIVERSLLNGFTHLPPATVDQVVAFPDMLKCISP